MFTPAFILIPARETLPGKEVGLLIGWFIPSQIIAFLFPVLLYQFLDRISHVSFWRSRREPEESIIRRGFKGPCTDLELGESPVAVRDSPVISGQGLGIHGVYLEPRGDSEMSDATRVNTTQSVTGDRTKKGTGGASPLAFEDSKEPFPHGRDIPITAPSRAARLTKKLTKLLTPAIYLIIALISLPIFYTTGHTLTLFLSINLLSYLFGVLVVPPKVKRVLHPILTASILTVSTLWGLGATKGWSLKHSGFLVNRWVSSYLIWF